MQASGIARTLRTSRVIRKANSCSKLILLAVEGSNTSQTMLRLSVNEGKSQKGIATNAVAHLPQCKMSLIVIRMPSNTMNLVLHSNEFGIRHSFYVITLKEKVALDVSITFAKLHYSSLKRTNDQCCSITLHRYSTAAESKCCKRYLLGKLLRQCGTTIYLKY